MRWCVLYENKIYAYFTKTFINASFGINQFCCFFLYFFKKQFVGHIRPTQLLKEKSLTVLL